MKITLRPVDATRRNAYGLLLEAVGTVGVIGPRVHNRGFRHRLQVFADGRLVFKPEPAVIANPPRDPSPHLGHVRTGGLVELDITTSDRSSWLTLNAQFRAWSYRVQGQLLDDPILVPVPRRRTGFPKSGTRWQLLYAPRYEGDPHPWEVPDETHPHSNLNATRYADDEVDEYDPEAEAV